MRVSVIGAGPAGLYCSYLLKRRWPQATVRVIEQSAAGAAFGFGVVFSDRALSFLGEDDPETLAAIAGKLESWSGITIDHAGERIVLDGVGFSAIGRLDLLEILTARLAAVGVTPEYGRGVARLGEVMEADLVIAADGVNSVVRRELAGALGAGVTHLENRFAWFGTTRRFETMTQSFRATGLGSFNAHHYRYSPEMSTFIVECDAATFARVGFEQLPDAETRAICERVFADALGGAPLVSNRTLWRRFPVVACNRWSAGRVVLLGDAAHTAHYSIGSGTRLALEDAIALDRALAASPGDVAKALADYEAVRRPVVETLIAAASASAQWYEGFADHMGLAPWDFAMSYAMRSGRMDAERLRRHSPRFVAGHEAAMRAAGSRPALRTRQPLSEPHSRAGANGGLTDG